MAIDVYLIKARFGHNIMDLEGLETLLETKVMLADNRLRSLSY